jgi:hypothetical protein
MDVRPALSVIFASRSANAFVMITLRVLTNMKRIGIAL